MQLAASLQQSQLIKKWQEHWGRAAAEMLSKHPEGPPPATGVCWIRGAIAGSTLLGVVWS